jgi:hypothetical protein
LKKFKIYYKTIEESTIFEELTKAYFESYENLDKNVKIEKG